ncbi:hypothetical protein AGLY_004646 [Aphis glycines]|uniref:Uncharacterized protein n=1 Tax=Aphis glycines TaxID=307491 RepID=A0A6G0TUW6_APHGL|nr:hypothetical protein AGLY_004646 [Aphis glycines]
MTKFIILLCVPIPIFVLQFPADRTNRTSPATYTGLQHLVNASCKKCYMIIKMYFNKNPSFHSEWLLMRGMRFKSNCLLKLMLSNLLKAIKYYNIVVSQFATEGSGLKVNVGNLRHSSQRLCVKQTTPFTTVEHRLTVINYPFCIIHRVSLNKIIRRKSQCFNYKELFIILPCENYSIKFELLNSCINSFIVKLIDLKCEKFVKHLRNNVKRTYGWLDPFNLYAALKTSRELPLEKRSSVIVLFTYYVTVCPIECLVMTFFIGTFSDFQLVVKWLATTVHESYNIHILLQFFYHLKACLLTVCIDFWENYLKKLRSKSRSSTRDNPVTVSAAPSVRGLDRERNGVQRRTCRAADSAWSRDHKPSSAHYHDNGRLVDLLPSSSNCHSYGSCCCAHPSPETVVVLCFPEAISSVMLLCPSC